MKAWVVSMDAGPYVEDGCEVVGVYLDEATAQAVADRVIGGHVEGPFELDAVFKSPE